jgi:uncharacterized membrane protein
MQEIAMHDWLTVIALNVTTIINAMALLTVAFGTAQAFVGSVQAMFGTPPGGRTFHAIYIQYARWLVGGLTFQLAADIIATAFSPSWDEIGRLAAIAIIRTFVNFFLERDLAEQERRVIEEQRETIMTRAP